MIKLDV